MRKRHLPNMCSFILITMFLITGCQKNDCKRSYTLRMPVYKTLAEARAGIKTEGPRAIKNTGKIYISGNYILLCEKETGIHIIDNTNPGKPKNISFISITGNTDMAVKGNIMYADSYNDLVAFDISNPAFVTKVGHLNNIMLGGGFYSYMVGITGNPDSIRVVAGYTERDTVMSCEDYNAWNGGRNCPDCWNLNTNFSSSAISVSKGGSMARYTIVGNYLYAVSTNDLKIFDVSKPADPVYKSKYAVGAGIETIYPFKNNLFIGSTTGMFIYDITQPESPVKLSRFEHGTVCDPVVADENYAYVTLRSDNTWCQGISNELNVVNISNLRSPVLKKTYPLTHPHGLSKDGNIIFICDGKDGLRVYNTGDGYTLKLIGHIEGPETYDVITSDRRALVVAKDGLYQYDYRNLSNIRLLSHIGLSQKD